MSDTDKMKNKAQELKGAAKEKMGEASGDRDKAAEGRADRTKANIKQAGEKLKDAAKGARRDE